MGNDLKKVLGGVLGAVVGLLLCGAFMICTVYNSTIGSLFQEDQTDLFEIIVNHHSITDQFKGENFDDWLPDARDEVYSFRKKKLFKDSSDATDVEKTKNYINDVMSTSVLFTYWVVEHTSVCPDTFSIDWEDYAECFTGTDYEADGYDYKTDESFSNLEVYLGIEIDSTRRSTIVAYAKQIKGHISSEQMLAEYDENTNLSYDTNECQELWDRIFEDIKNNPNVLGHGNNDRDNPQCTDFAEWRLWLATGCGTAGGNGKDVVQYLCSHPSYRDKFELSSTPKAGAIFSVDNGTKWGHVGYVEAVDEDYIWISDGNIKLNGQEHGIRINAKFSKDYFFNQKYGGCTIQFAVPK